MEIKYYTQPLDCDGNSFYLGIKLNEILKSQKPFYNKIWMVASFTKLSGVSKLKAALKKSVKSKAEIKFVLGTGKNLTTVEALNELIQIGCSVRIYRGINGNSFGAKMFCFEAENERAEVFISSGNITEGGLYKNNELVVNVTYDLSNEDKILYSQFKNSLSNYFEPSGINSCELTQEVIGMLIDAGEISYESETKSKNKPALGKIKSKKEEKSKSDEHELLSIILPTGDSIEVSLDDESDDLEKRLEPAIEPDEKKNGKSSAKKKKEQKTQDPVQDDMDIEIEESVRVEETEALHNPEEINQEFAEDSYTADFNKTSKDKIRDIGVLIDDYNVIDIEKMLYFQQHEDDIENIEHKHQAAISPDAIEFIKSKETKKAAKKAKEKTDNKILKESEPIEQKVKTKFIISSIAKKNGTGIINSFFMQINKLKGRGISGEVRMPIASREFSPEFWGWPNSYKISHAEGKSHKKCKKWQVKCRIIDVENPSNIVVDTCELYQEEGKSNFNFLSNMLVSLEPQENDILRVIRCGENDECVFQCELIRAGSKEYEIWEQFCSNIIKGTGRRYGFA